jgi:hypothetical protein
MKLASHKTWVRSSNCQPVCSYGWVGKPKRSVVAAAKAAAHHAWRYRYRGYIIGSEWSP